MEVVVFIGIQATGKSTFYQRRFSNSHIRLNLDMLRTRRREEILMRACLEARQPFVIDNTNATRESRANYIEQGKAAGFSVTGYYFGSDLQAAIDRNNQRSGKARIPEKGIVATHRKLELPSYDEGFDRLFYVEMGVGGEFLVSEWIDDV